MMIERLAFYTYTPHLEHLSLAYNCLTDVFPIMESVSYLKYLLTIDVSFQQTNPIQKTVISLEGRDFILAIYWNRVKQIRVRRVGLRYITPDETVNNVSLGDVAEVSDNQTSASISRIFSNTLLREYSHQNGINEDRHELVSQEIGSIRKTWPDPSREKPISCPSRLEELNMAADCDGRLRQFFTGQLY